MKPTAASTASSLLRFALFAYLLSMIVLITLLPFRFQWPTQVCILAQANLFDVVTNLSLFLPLGFCYRRVRPEQHDRRGVRTLPVFFGLGSLGVGLAVLGPVVLPWLAGAGERRFRVSDARDAGEGRPPALYAKN